MTSGRAYHRAVTGNPRELPRTAVAGRAAGDGGVARAAYVRAYDAARSAGDVDAMTEAAVGLAAGQLFGTVPGQVPAFLHEAYIRASGVQRTRVAIALARTWVYGGAPVRAVPYAEEAVTTAESAGDAVLLADALDAQLLAHWGPDDLPVRVRITRRLEDTVSHVADVDVRMTAHLWGLTTALECLDLPSAQRQLRALEALAEESDAPRVRFFATARRGMHALLTGDAAEAARYRDTAVACGADAGEADTLAIERTLSAGIARLTGEAEALAREAALHEEFGAREGIPLISAMGAVLWLESGATDRAGGLLHQLAAGSLAAVPRDVYWLVTVTALTEVALGTGASDLAAEGVTLLEPYAGRGVVDAGGVLFLGVVDDYLYRGLLALGRIDEAEARQLAALRAYQRMGASWWMRRVAGITPSPHPTDVVCLQPDGAGVWLVGRYGSTRAVPEMKGLRYLRLLLARPGSDIPALELSDAVAGHAGERVTEGDVGTVADRRALAAYRRRLAELDEELDRADRRGDAGRGQRLTSERAALLAQVAAATGFGGRPRVTGATAERARVAVRKAIAAALARISAVDPPVGRLLADTVSTGITCRYEPDPGRPVRWLLHDRAGPPTQHVGERARAAMSSTGAHGPTLDQHTHPGQGAP